MKKRLKNALVIAIFGVAFPATVIWLLIIKIEHIFS